MTDLDQVIALAIIFGVPLAGYLLWAVFAAHRRGAALDALARLDPSLLTAYGEGFTRSQLDERYLADIDHLQRRKARADDYTHRLSNATLRLAAARKDPDA